MIVNILPVKSRNIKLLLGLTIVFLGLTFIKPAKALADCGVSTGSSGSMAGAVINSYWYRDDGTVAQSNNTQVRVETYGSTSSPPGNVVRLDSSSTSIIDRVHTASFNQDNFGCNDDGVQVVLGYGSTSSRTDGTGGPWAIDCDASIHGIGNEQQMLFTGEGVPSGARPGGSWSVEIRRPANGFTEYVDLYYTQPPPSTGPPPAPSWSLCPEPGNTSSHVRISWNTANNPSGTTGYVVDVDDDWWAGGHWNKNSSGSNNVNAPMGFNFYPTPGSGLTFNVGQKYQARVFYEGATGPHKHSDTAEFTAPDCSSSSTVTISGRVMDSSGNGVSGINVFLCGLGHATTNSSGNWSKSGVAVGTGFCARVHLDNSTSGGAEKCPFDKYRATNSIGNNGCSPPNNYTYEFQVAGQSVSNGHDRSSDSGYDFRAPSGPPPITAPTASAFCSSTGVSSFSISWSEAGRGANGYYVDLSPVSSFSQMNNKSVPSGTTSTTGPGGFNGYAGYPTITALNAGDTYHLRVNYPQTGEHSPSTSFVAATCATFSLAPQAGPVNLSPNDEVPTGVSFSSNVNASITGPAGSPTQIKGVFFDRKFFIRRGGLQIPLSGPTPSAPDPNNNATVPFSPTVIDSGPLNPVPVAGDEVCQTVTIRPTSGTVDGSGNIVADNGVTMESAPACRPVAVKPYFRVYNSDVSAGFKECPGWAASASTGTITAWNKGPSDPGAGSGTQLAAFAINAIDGFSSANGRTVGPQPPLGLTFANDSAGPNGFGKAFGAGFCAHDYYSGAPTPLPLPVPVNLSLLGSGQYSFSSPSLPLIISGGNVSSGKKVTIYMDGNVIIDGTLGGGITYDTSWADIDSIPNFTLVVRGNIYITPSVKNLSGVFIAQPNGASGGTIYTCASGPGLLPSPSSLPLFDYYTICKDQLTIHGAFIAKVVRLMRTGGTLAQSTNLEGGTTATAAEKFIFSPEAWLSSSVFPSDDRDRYDSITSIAPVL